jgi:hypothetical protein
MSVPQVNPLLPLPGDRVDDGIVIASTWMDDDPVNGHPTALLMVLQPEPPYYGIFEITGIGGTWEFRLLEEHPNINPATEAYSENGGDY